MDATDVAIVGLGFTGLPVAVIAAEAGLRVVGIDRSPRRVREIVSGAPGCGLGTVCERALRDVINRKALRVQEASGPPTPARTTVLCVPTPAGESRGADLRPLLAAADAVAPRLRRGDLVLVQSTCPVGTVERVLAPAASKPTGFVRHRPGPGAGGGCVPVAARFFAASARQYGLAAPVVEAAITQNDAAPALVLNLVRRLLAMHQLPPLAGSRVLVVGITYRPDVADVRRAAGLRILEQLRLEANPAYHDPYVPELVLPDGTTLRSRALRPGSADLALVLTRHRTLDSAALGRCAGVVVDCSTGTPHLLTHPTMRSSLAG
jgi:UDP-N-acetyl-D-mannosaminuronate dehydrogenase